ncbi:MAG: LLM class flavin-dependent oxidoreductase [Nocardioidaceae bacterium]
MTDTIRTSLRLNNDLTVAEFVDLCVIAEELGFDQVWVSNDLYLRSASVMLTAAAAATSRVGLGVGIMNPYSMDPAEIAMMATSLQEYSGGRFALGLGAGAAEFLGWAGIAQAKPLTRTREALQTIRALLRGEHDGGPDSLAYLRFEPCDVPIYLGAMSPKMLALTGELADGALPLLYPPEHYPVAAAQILGAAAAAGRAADEIDLAACIWVSVDTDGDAARWAMAEKIAYYGASFAPYLLERAGLSRADFHPVQAALAADGIDVATRLITPQMLQLGIAGTPDEVVERCRSLMGFGVRHLSFGPPLGPDPHAAVHALGSTVLARLQAR